MMKKIKRNQSQSGKKATKFRRICIVLFLYCIICGLAVTICLANTTRTDDKINIDDLLPRKEMQQPQPQPKINPPRIIKLIKPGKHINIPPPEQRIGPNGEKGFVHDPKFLVKDPRQFRIVEDEKDILCAPPGNGTEGQKGPPDLAKIRHHIETSQEKRNVTLFCAIYTYSARVNHTIAISETWGNKCDGMLYASDHSNIETGHVHIPSNSRAKFGYRGMIQRTRAILAYIYDNFLDDYDYFHLSGDDIFMMVENMKEFLASDMVREWEEVQDQYLFAGFWMNWGNMEDGSFYLGGGSGYTLSKKSLKAYVEGPLQTCDTRKEGSSEDVAFTDCARNLTNKFIDTRDSSGAYRYHQLSVSSHLNRQVRKSLEHMQRLNITVPQPLMDIEDKSEYTSKSSVVFHKHNYAHELRRMELLLYKNLTDECKG